MHQAEDIIFAESMLCPIYYYVDIYLLSQKVEGF
jgi:oligopeptide transport system substrate-binding protein